MDKFTLTLLHLALSKREYEVLELMIQKNVFEFKKIASLVPFSSGYLSVLLKRLQEKGFLYKEINEIHKTYTYMFTFNELIIYFRSHKTT